MKTSQDKFDLLQRFIRWREKHITNKQFYFDIEFSCWYIYRIGCLCVEVSCRIYKGVPDREF